MGKCGEDGPVVPPLLWEIVQGVGICPMWRNWEIILTTSWKWVRYRQGLFPQNVHWWQRKQSRTPRRSVGMTIWIGLQGGPWQVRGWAMNCVCSWFMALMKVKGQPETPECKCYDPDSPLRLATWLPCPCCLVLAILLFPGWNWATLLRLYFLYRLLPSLLSFVLSAPPCWELNLFPDAWLVSQKEHSTIVMCN